MKAQKDAEAQSIPAAAASAVCEETVICRDEFRLAGCNPFSNGD